MDYAPLLVEIPNAMCNLQNDVARKILAEICQLDDLVEQLSAFADCGSVISILGQRVVVRSTHAQAPGSSAPTTRRTGGA